MTEPVAHQDAAALMQRLGGWLSGRMAGAPSVEIRDVVEPSQGFSSRTILFTAAIRAEGGWRERPLVARLQRDVAVPMLADVRSEEHTSELQSLMRISYAVFCLKKKNKMNHQLNTTCTRIQPRHTKPHMQT